MMTAVIVDDEQNGREVLRTALEEYSEGIQVVGEGHDVKSGIRIIKKTRPDVLFLDVELPDGKGFEIIDQLGDQSCKVVFVTAYDDYAIKAIRYAAIDYLVKPLDLDDLEATIDRLKSQPALTTDNIQVMTNHLNNVQGAAKRNAKIMVPSHSGYQILVLKEIISIEAAANYVLFTMTDGRRHLAAHSLNYYEDLLSDDRFYRIHKSHIVNMSKVTSVEPGRTGKALLENGAELDIAARRKAAFMAYMKRYLPR